MTHPPPQQLQALVTGTLSESAVDALEAHLSSCDDCAARLAALAQEELALYEIAEAAATAPSASLPPPAPRRRWFAVAGLAAAAAAAVAVWQATPAPPAPEPPAPAVVMVSHCATQVDTPCAADAAQQGLMIGGAVPRYESFMPGMPRYDPPVRR